MRNHKLFMVQESIKHFPIPLRKSPKVIAGNFLVGVLISAFCIFNFTACTTLTKSQRQSQGVGLLEPQQVLRFGDIPVPAGFKFLPQGSYSFESSGVRVAVLKYQGKASAEQLTNFYKEQMPIYNWNLLNIIEYDQRLMNFERETETCIVNLLPKGSSTLLTISLGPKSQVPKKAAKPLK